MSVTLDECPACFNVSQKYSLFYNKNSQLWECLNPACKRKFTIPEYSQYWHEHQTPEKKQKPAEPKPVESTPGLVFNTPVWLVNVLESKNFWFFSICLSIGLWAWQALISPSYSELSRAIGFLIPILLLACLRYVFKTSFKDYRAIRNSRKLANVFIAIRRSQFLRFLFIVSIIALLFSIPFTGYQVFTGNSGSPFYLILLLIIQIVFFIWLIRILNTTIYTRRPKFKSVFLSTLAIIILCVIFGIPPFLPLKESIVSYWAGYTASLNNDKNSNIPISQPTMPQTGSQTSYTSESNSDTAIQSFQNIQPPYAKTLGDLKSIWLITLTR